MQQNVISSLAALAIPVRWTKDRDIFSFDVPLPRRVAQSSALMRRRFNLSARGRGERVRRRSLGRTPHICMAEETHARDLFTPPQSPAPRDPSSSVEMTASGGKLNHTKNTAKDSGLLIQSIPSWGSRLGLRLPRSGG